ncbi:MAG: site-specific recombinase [Methylophilaceae bacterium]
MMEQILRRYAEKQGAEQQHAKQNGNPATLLADLVTQIRPPKASQSGYAVHAIQTLCHILNCDPGKAQLLRAAILNLLGEHKPVSLFVDSGVLPSSGFFTEMWRRISHKLLPDAVNPAYLKDLFALIFPKPSDEEWVLAVPDAVWLQLLQALHLEHASAERILSCRQNLLDAVQVLSYRLSASGLEPELVRNHPELEDHTSPFIVQNMELGEFLTASTEQAVDSKHLLVMLDQCRKVIAKIHRSSSQIGTSIQLTFLLQRMTQQIRRLESLLSLIVSLRAGENTDMAFIQMFKTVVYAECHKNDVRQYWQDNMALLALRVTENASRTGEHYITETRSEYFALMRSAMGAGVIVGVMAMIKIITADQHYAPLTEAILFSLNYGLGFVLIHVLHFTVATKQPAMTAAAIAESIDASEGKSREMGKLVSIIAQTMRSQIVAILGNVLLVVPVAMLIAWFIHVVSGQHFVTPEKAHTLLADIDPLQSGALFYAGIAGVCLFLSGLIAGYHDNLAVYNKIPQRLRALGWLQKLLGPARLDRVADYIENNLGALAGNFYFGCLLGGMAALGVLLGLPVDIRHVAFSSAFAGFSFVGLDFAISKQMFLMAALGAALIGAVNLVVSFSLALYVAMKSRNVTFLQWRLLIAALAIRLYQHPREFFLPQRKEKVSDEPRA